jgi:hypothetical protein
LSSVVKKMPTGLAQTLVGSKLCALTIGDDS